MVASDIYRVEDRGKLMLGRSDLIVLCLGGNTQPPQRFVQLPHKGGDAQADAAKIMILHFLSLCGLRAVQRAPADL